MIAEHPNTDDAALDGDVLLSTKQVRKILGNIAPATLWRWRRDATIGFPAPLSMGGLVLFRRNEIIEWVANRPRA